MTCEYACTGWLVKLAKGCRHFFDLAYSKCSVLEKCIQAKITLHTLAVILCVKTMIIL